MVNAAENDVVTIEVLASICAALETTLEQLGVVFGPEPMKLMCSEEAPLDTPVLACWSDGLTNSFESVVLRSDGKWYLTAVPDDEHSIPAPDGWLPLPSVAL